METRVEMEMEMEMEVEKATPLPVLVWKLSKPRECTVSACRPCLRSAPARLD